MAWPAAAQTVAIGLDAKARLQDGELEVVRDPAPDAVAFYRFTGSKPLLLGRVPAPISFQGPPRSIALSTRQGLALGVSSRRIDPNQPAALVPDNRVSLFDLEASPIRVVQTLALSAAPTSIALSPDGGLAVVTHVDEDKLTLLSIADKRATVLEVVALQAGSGPLGAAFSPQGDDLLVALAKANRVAVFKVNGRGLTLPAVREMSAGVWPASVSFCGRTGLAVVANYGKVTGDLDTISLIDTKPPARVIDTVSVGPSPEGVACSNDGRHAAAAIQNMSTIKKADAFYSPNSQVVLVAITRGRMQVTDQAVIGGWAQGVDFLDDNRTLFAQSMNDSALHLFEIQGRKLAPHGAPIVFKDGAPAAYGVSGR
jgi:DNA-binding beta-propeller fold protein YncE